LLEAAGVSLVIEPPIETEVEAAATDEAAPDDGTTENGQPEEELVRRIQSDLGDVQMSGTALILAAGDKSRREVVVLAASAEGLENTLARLIALSSSPAEPALHDCMVQEELALCPSGVTDEPVEAELVTSGQPEQAPAGGQTPGGPDVSGLDADIQGPISLGDSVEGTLDEDQSHGWEFSDGPATVNIVLEAGEDLDGVLELYDPEGSLMADADFTLEGDVERLDSVQIPDDQTYTIVVRDYYDDGGSYTLSVTAVTPESLGAVDQGELLPGQPVDAILGENESHAWTFTVDEPAEADITLTCGPTMDGYLILVGPDGSFLEVVDNALTGEEETLTGYSLTETGDYTIVVGEYSDSGGEYTLLLELN
jgi:hypothetical protein